MGSGFAYSSVGIYRMVMRLLYRGDYGRKYQGVADLIPPGATVVDLCAGDCVLAAKLAGKGCQYLGLELNPRFVKWARRAGIDARVFDVRTGEIPAADVVCMQSSLYHFMPGAEALLARMIRSARQSVIVSEPVVNLSASRHSFLARLAVSATAVNGEPHPFRHSLDSLTRIMEQLEPRGVLIQRHRREALFLVSKNQPTPGLDDIPRPPMLQRRSSPEAERRTRHADAGAAVASV